MSRSGPDRVHRINIIVATSPYHLYFVWHKVLTTRFAFFRFHRLTCQHLLESQFSLCSLRNEKTVIKTIYSYVMVIFPLFSFHVVCNNFQPLYICCSYTYICNLWETIMQITYGCTWFEKNANLPNLLSLRCLICIHVDRLLTKFYNFCNLQLFLLSI